MERTRSMYYEESVESRELYLYAVNNEAIYSRHVLPAIKSLARKYKAGRYDAGRAVDLFFYVATTAGKEYGREYGGAFSVQERYTAAVEMERACREKVEEG